MKTTRCLCYSLHFSRLFSLFYLSQASRGELSNSISNGVISNDLGVKTFHACTFEETCLGV